MARIIFKCPYLKGGTEKNIAHLSNFTNYISTREGVEILNAKNKNLPTTKKQNQLIEEILKDFPNTKNLFEYEDYLENKTIENASEFITIALEQNLYVAAKKENYVDYIANRPRVEKLSSHGLFTAGDEKIVLSKVAEEIANHQGNVWTPIISLKRKDAITTGFDNAERWKDFLEQYAMTIAKNLKIEDGDFRWYAAFHNERHHPHIHMICYSTNPKKGYLTKKGIENIKSGLVANIFTEEMKLIYAEQSKRRDELKLVGKETLAKLISQMNSDAIENKNIEALFLELSEKLKHTKGKRVYGYLQPSIKNIVNSIIDELVKEQTVADAYNLWYEMRNEVLRSYSDKVQEPLPLSKQKEFKSLKNFIISEADKLSKGEITFDEVEKIEIEETATAITDEFSEQIEHLDYIKEAIYDDVITTKEPYVKWTTKYKQAHEFLFGTEQQELNFGKAIKLLKAEAESGNILAVFDLGRMYTDGLETDIDTKKAQKYYVKALNGFRFVESKKAWKYTQYRIGKMYSQGLGTKQNYELAAKWFSKSANEKYKFAEYFLGGQYLRGQGVDQDYENAFELYLRSAKQGFPYANFEVAKMYRDGQGVPTDNSHTENEKNINNDVCVDSLSYNQKQSNYHFAKAFIGFEALEKQSHDDKIGYRLGCMLQNGIGIEKDMAKAKEYFQKSAKLGNTFACYSFAKIILAQENPTKDELKQAVKYLQISSDSGNESAQYALGKLYYEGKHTTQNIPKAVELFTLSAEKNNQFSQYQLGKLHLMGKSVPKDKETAIKWFTLSAEQGNEYAKFFLENMDKWKELSTFSFVSKLLHNMSRIFENNLNPQKSPVGMKVDSKLIRRMREKKLAQGQKISGHDQEINL